jgi:DNA (cytosine-5)-methyltransferase 1
VLTSDNRAGQRVTAAAHSPAPAELQALRARHGLTQSAAAALVHSTLSGYQRWEQGERRMHAGLWELLRIKVGET